MNPDRILIAMQRLADAPDVEAMRRVWNSLKPEERAHPKVRELKDDLKQAREAVERMNG